MSGRLASLAAGGWNWLSEAFFIHVFLFPDFILPSLSPYVGEGVGDPVGEGLSRTCPGVVQRLALRILLAELSDLHHDHLLGIAGVEESV